MCVAFPILASFSVQDGSRLSHYPCSSAAFSQAPDITMAKHMSAEEARLVRLWYDVDEKQPSEIAELLHRAKSTITRFLKKPATVEPVGRQRAFTEEKLKALEAKLEEMVKKADGKYEVTVAKLRKAMRLKVCDRTIRDALHDRGVYFRHFRRKPVLSAADIASRKKFAKKYSSKSATWWRTHVHLHIDVKHFPVYLHGAARHHFAVKGTRGAYRKRGQGLDAPYVQTSSQMKFNTGARGVKVLAGVANGKVLVWSYIDNKRWNGAQAAKMYEGPVLKALQQKFPRRASWNVLEDNDPAGFKSSKAVRAKAKAGIKVFPIPRRSPDLNVCDYALWAEVNRRMRKQEANWESARRETRKAYLARLRRTALRLPADFVNKSIGDMRKRCLRLEAAAGKHFREGA